MDVSSLIKNNKVFWGDDESASPVKCTRGRFEIVYKELGPLNRMNLRGVRHSISRSKCVVGENIYFYLGKLPHNTAYDFSEIIKIENTHVFLFQGKETGEELSVAVAGTSDPCNQKVNNINVFVYGLSRSDDRIRYDGPEHRRDTTQMFDVKYIKWKPPVKRNYELIRRIEKDQKRKVPYDSFLEYFLTGMIIPGLDSISYSSYDSRTHFSTSEVTFVDSRNRWKFETVTFTVLNNGYFGTFEMHEAKYAIKNLRSLIRFDRKIDKVVVELLGLIDADLHVSLNLLFSINSPFFLVWIQKYCFLYKLLV